MIILLIYILITIIFKNKNIVLLLVLIELEGLAKGGKVRESVCEAANQALKILKNIDSAAVKFVTTKGSSFKSTTFFEEENNFVCVVILIKIINCYFNDYSFR